MIDELFSSMDNDHSGTIDANDIRDANTKRELENSPLSEVSGESSEGGAGERNSEQETGRLCRHAERCFSFPSRLAGRRPHKGAACQAAVEDSPSGRSDAPGVV